MVNSYVNLQARKRVAVIGVDGGLNGAVGREVGCYEEVTVSK